VTDLTPRQHELLCFIERYLAAFGYPPSLRDIGAAFGYASTNAASEALDALQAKGYIARTPKVSRGLRVLRSAS
jgi:repressor LexA